MANKRSENKLQTSVTGDADLAALLRSKGYTYGQIFQAGLEMLSGIDDESLERLQEQLNEKEEEKKQIDYEIKVLKDKIEQKKQEIEAAEAQKQQADMGFDKIYNEFVRLIPKIIFDGQTKYLNHLANLHENLNRDKINNFISDRNFISNSEISQFLKGELGMEIETGDN